MLIDQKPYSNLQGKPNGAAGGFWFTLGSTLTPSFNAYGAYAKDPTEPWEGLTSDGFHASYGGCILRDQSCLPFQLMVVL